MRRLQTSPIELRIYQEGDAPLLRQLFFQTVHTINRKDYSQSQCDAWAPKEYDQKEWANNLKHNFTLVAVAQDDIVGFADMDGNGYIEHLFVHANYQGRGVASGLMKAIEVQAIEQGFAKLRAQVSVTAQPFFTKCGFFIVKKQHKKHRGEVFINYTMVKKLS